tara:strand:+ start:492 stop:2270 length:1779 start_codon:yes stop_codon:yes gene_type:complete
MNTNETTRGGSTGARLVGGAGTGKTTELLNIMEKIIDRGFVPQQIGFVSYTRAARSEAAERAAKKFTGVSAAELSGEFWFRTIHSLCFKQLDSPKGFLLNTRKEDAAFIAAAIGAKDEGVAGISAKSAPSLKDTNEMTVLNLWAWCRSRLVSLAEGHQWATDAGMEPPPIRTCIEKVTSYERAKYIDNRLDPEDLLARFAGIDFDAERGPLVSDFGGEGDVPEVPVWFFDEQQDASPLLDKVAKRLVSGPACRWYYLTGDPFQSIYSFSGADSRCFMAWDVKERIMPQSYRCPKPIHELGERVLKGCTDYFDRGIRPAEHEGRIEEMNSISRVADRVRADESWLLIARSNWHANRMGKFLTARGIPWFPTSGVGGWGSPVRNAAVLALRKVSREAEISPGEFRALTKEIPSKVDGVEMFKRGTKKRFNQEPEKWRAGTKAKGAEQVDSEEVFDLFFDPQPTSAANAVESMQIQYDELETAGATPELIQYIKGGKALLSIPKGKEINRAYDQHGEEVLAKSDIQVGTIHSVKGSEADNVAFLTTISKIVQRGMQTKDGEDEEKRIQYVAITRARKNLFIINESDANYRYNLGR